MEWLKAVKFKESNCMATGKGYFDLPTRKDSRMFTSCWRVSFWKRIKLLFTGKIWLCLEHERQPEEMKKLFGGKNYHQPVMLTTDYPFGE